MRRLLLVLLLLAFGMEGLRAGTVDVATALKAAKGFTATTSDSRLRNEQPRLVLATPDYFVFNVGETGFVIISSDDCFRPVIGYSYEGTFVEPASPELAYYLENMAQGRHAALRASIQQDETVREEWTRLLEGRPLPSRNGGRASFYLVQTRWDQGAPYNRFCPPFNGGALSYAGCVATAMSQVMNYWRHPSHGYGNHSYIHQQYGELSADFASANYDFDKMPLTLVGATEEEINEVALFMFHCGIAVNMSYSPDGSGAYSQDVPEAVMSYFNYSNSCRHINRDDYSLGEFQTILKNQFDLGWPCYYSGSDADAGSGHAFVCDGYDDNDMFHFNWGWSGSGNGYFAIDALNVNSYAWNSGQAVLLNFVPGTVFDNTTVIPGNFTAVPNGDESFSVTLSWTNPKEMINGTPLETIDQMVVKRDGVVVKTFDDAVPGEAMSYVDVTGLPIAVDYSIHAVVNDVNGRVASAKDVKLGPSCDWTVKMRSDSDAGWPSGSLTLLNSSGEKVGSFAAESADDTFDVEVSQGWTTFLWTAPADSMNLGFDIIDGTGSTVFSYDGPSAMMPQGTFFEMVNTCEGEGSLEHPSNLKANVEGEDVVLEWTGIADPGYGYIIYRDGLLHSMVADATSFVDHGSASTLHSYHVTAFTMKGESDPSNTCSAISTNEEMCPRSLSFEELAGGNIMLSWEAPENAENLSGYRIYSRRKGESFSSFKNLSASHLSYKLGSSLEPGCHYDFTVVGIYNNGAMESGPAQSALNADQHFVSINYTHLPSNLKFLQEPGILYFQWDKAFLADSYNVYCNGEKIAESLTETLYTDTISTERSLRIYQVTGVRNGVESSPSNKAVFGNTSVGENGLAEAGIYPNPSKGVFTVKAESMTSITVYSLTGQRMLYRPVSGNQVEVDLSGLPTGVYFVLLASEQGNAIQKVVLVK
ncbi:MAG: C10 family peptidase [Bacteroidales bacterium]|nr:C10 family peptidase [Bacteroidales bacterium]